MLRPLPTRLIAVLQAVFDNPEGHLNPVQKVGASEVKVGALLTLMDLLDNSFYL